MDDIPEPADPRDGYAEADRRLLLGRVRACLDSLAPREREVFVLRELEGMAVEEVAKSLELAAPTVRRHLARARLHLRELLGGGEEKEHGD